VASVTFRRLLLVQLQNKLELSKYLMRVLCVVLINKDGCRLGRPCFTLIPALIGPALLETWLIGGVN